jgi:cytochrome c-type biogenesis protein CcmH/NrfG
MARKARFEQAESNLQKLTDLHEAGILTDEEFEQKKAQLEARSVFPG